MAAASGTGDTTGLEQGELNVAPKVKPPVIDESALVHLKAVPPSDVFTSNPAQRKVLFIYTGGTLGMKPRDDGGCQFCIFQLMIPSLSFVLQECLPLLLVT
jgi:hypothetical protein